MMQDAKMNFLPVAHYYVLRELTETISTALDLVKKILRANGASIEWRPEFILIDDSATERSAVGKSLGSRVITCTVSRRQ